MIFGFRVIRLKAMRAVCLRGGTAQIIRCLSPLFAFYLCLSAKNAQIILVFFCGCFSSVIYASSLYEDMGARDSLYAAAKQALNVGEPRTVRMIYFLPNDRPFQQAVVDSMKVTIRQIQTFYVDQMEAHGYGRKTFRFETDAQGDPVVHRVDGQHPDSYYVDGGSYWQDIRQKFDTRANNVYWTVWDNSIRGIGGAGGRGGGGRDGGSATVSERFGWTTVAHELGHAFGLQHDFRDGNYIMSYGPRSGEHQLSACHAEFLSVHPYFDPDIPDEKTPGPKIELISPNEYPTGSKSVSVQLKVSDPDGLHQVILFNTTRQPHSAAGFFEVKGCRGLNDKKEIVVQFDYDGVVPSDGGTSLFDLLAHPVYVEAVDSFGNVGYTSFNLFDASTPHDIIAILEGHTHQVQSVVFSPDGTLLASGSGDDTVKLWNVATKRNIATLSGHSGSVTSVSFSPDGTLLVSGARDATVRLWDVAAQANIVPLSEHRYGVNAVSFSPDGTVLAFGSSDGAVRLWDVAAQANIATLSGHSGSVTSVSFSPDGTLLASGSSDDTVRLWDVAAQANIATLSGHSGNVTSVSFSPDGTVLASGSSDDTVRLWDVAAQANIVTLSGHSGNVTSVSFSPDGTLLASGSRDKTVKLWNVVLGRTIVTLWRHQDVVSSVSFSPDGTLLASGSWDKTVKLWNVEKLTQPRPHTLVKISGNNQKGLPSAPLANPLVVEVKDQNGNVLKGVAVTFSVTEGDGKLSIKTALTDSIGRAQTVLTLGNTLGITIVAVTVTGIDQPVIFASKAIATPDFDSDGTVSFADFLLFVEQFGFSQEDEGYQARFDLDGNGVIGFGDFLIFVNAFGKKVS